MESRKRSRTEDGDNIPAKKRIINDEGDSPRSLNGTTLDMDEPKDDDHLEMFRKDAIYRRMKHYSRENERSLAKIAELEQRRSQCEASLAALEACWTQLIDTIRSLSRPEDLPPLAVESQDIYDLSVHVSSEYDPLYVQNLCNKMQATQQLVSAFVQLGGKAQAPLLKDEMYRRCQRAQTECTSLRSQVSLIRNKLINVESEKERFYEQLVVSQKRVDRLQSKTLAAQQSHASSPKSVENVKDESPQDSPSSPVPPQPAVNGIHAEGADIVELREILEIRERKIEELEKENETVKEEAQFMRIQLNTPPEVVVLNTRYYKALQEHASRLENNASEACKDSADLRDQLEQLRSTRLEWEREFTIKTEKVVQEQRQLLAKRDNENLRIREQRDQHWSELNERKQKEHVKFASINELKSLAESRAERINILTLEVDRLKKRLAAKENDEDLLTFLFRDHAAESSYVDDLKQRISAAEDRATALENSLSFLQDDHPDVAQHIRAEVEATQHVAELSRKLKEYETIFGPGLSSQSPDVQALAEELRKKESEIEKLHLLEQQREETESSLYAELDKLSAAWEALDRQVKNKVFDLSALEDRLSKAGLDKAKSENKFYATMREKEAIENERKNIARNLEKQTKVVEKFQESEKCLQARIIAFEKEESMWKRSLDVLKDRVRALEGECAVWKIRVEGEHKRAEDFRIAMFEQDKVLERKRSELRKQEESLARTKREAEKQAVKSKTVAQTHTGSGSSTEAQLQAELDKCMTLLQCSTCKMNMRTTVITKCMHSFCKQCVDSRIASRQRKCPACGLAFSQGEVQQLFFQ